MTVDAVRFLLLAGSGLIAGLLGAMLGIGGGVFLVPALILGFQLPVHDSVAASLAAVVATSTAAGSVYVGEGLTNMRLAMTLETATTSGAIAGGLTAAVLPEKALLVIFAAFLSVTAVLLGVGKETGERTPPSSEGEMPEGYEERGTLGGAFRSPRTGELVRYRARRLPVGLAVSFVAGNLSGLLGIGGGFLKVPAMRIGMEVPTRVAAATSNFMIGVTASASLVIYLERGFLVPLIAAPVVLGVVAGALFGTRMSARVSGASLARLLAVLLVAVAVQMVLRATGIARG